MDSFVSDRLATFGLLGSNNAIAPDPAVALPDYSSGQIAASLGCAPGAFAFGYDDRHHGPRPNATARYWTEYGSPDHASGTFAAELEYTVHAIADRYGPLAVNVRGGLIAQVYLAACERLGIRCEKIFPVFLPFETRRAPGRYVEVLIEQAELEEFAIRLGREARCSDGLIAIETMMASKAGSAYLFDGYDVRVENNSFDAMAQREVGPASWCICDHERFSTYSTWLLQTGRRGVPSLFRWSPALLAAVLAHPFNLGFFRDGHLAGEPLVRRDNLSVRQAIAAEFCGRPLHGNIVEAVGSEEFGLFVQNLSRLLRTSNADTRTDHRLPLDLMLRRLNRSEAGLFTTDPALFGDPDA